MTRQTLVSSLAILVFGALGVACQSGGVGDPCIPNLEYSPGDPGAREEGAQIEDRSFQCETRVCLINHFRGRVSCPFGNPAGGSLYPGEDKECFVPGTTVKVTAAVPPQCRDRKDNVYCSCLCGREGEAADPDKFCECPSGFVCDFVTVPLDATIMRPGDKYCVKEEPRWNKDDDSTTCCSVDNPACPDRCDTGDMCGYSKNRQEL